MRDRAARAPGASAVPARNHLRLTRQVLRALRKVDLSESRLRTCLLVLEFTHCIARDAAPFREQKLFCELDGRMSEPQVCRDLKWLRKHRVIERGDGVYWFRPPTEWAVTLRAPEGRRARQLELELWLEKLESQLDLDLYELHSALREGYLEASANAPVAQQATGVAWQATGSLAHQATRVAQQATPPAAHINVCLKRSLNRSTLNGQSAAWKYPLRRVEEFFRLSGAGFLEDEMARSGGLWTVLAQKEGEVLERAVADLEDKERTGSRSENRAARLTALVRSWIEPARWDELFPGAARAT